MSKIEGTQVTLGEPLAAEAGAGVKSDPENLRVVGNYTVALEHGIAHLTAALIFRLIGELDSKLMTDVRSHKATPSEFRR